MVGFFREALSSLSREFSFPTILLLSTILLVKERGNFPPQRNPQPKEVSIYDICKKPWYLDLCLPVDNIQSMTGLWYTGLGKSKGAKLCELRLSVHDWSACQVATKAVNSNWGTVFSNVLHIQFTEIGKRAGLFAKLQQGRPGRELTQPSPRLLAEPCRCRMCQPPWR